MQQDNKTIAARSAQKIFLVTATMVTMATGETEEEAIEAVRQAGDISAALAVDAVPQVAGEWEEGDALPIGWSVKSSPPNLDRDTPSIEEVCEAREIVRTNGLEGERHDYIEAWLDQLDREAMDEHYGTAYA